MLFALMNARYFLLAWLGAVDWHISCSRQLVSFIPITPLPKTSLHKPGAADFLTRINDCISAAIINNYLPVIQPALRDETGLLGILLFPTKT